MSQFSDFLRAGLIGRGIPAYGDMHLLAKYLDTTAAIGAHTGQYFDPDKQFTSLATAEAAMTSARCDTLVLTPEAHLLAAALTVDLSNTNIVGMAPGGFGFAKRARIGMSTAFTPMITVSGSGNHFVDLYTQHGTAEADYVGWLISGSRNVFDGVHFAGPMNALQGGHASYIGVSVTGSENIFHNCIFGSKSIGRDEVTPNLKLAGGDNTFINCWFTVQLTDGDPIFVLVDNTTTVDAKFLNCGFFAFSPSHAAAMTVAFKVGAGDGSGQSADITIDPRCSFNNVSHIAASATMKFFWMPTVFAATADELNLLAINSATY